MNEARVSGDHAVDWSVVTWKGNRLHQAREFKRLSLREKIRRLEGMARVAEAFSPSRRPPSEQPRPGREP